MFGGVPIRVAIPPNIVANDKGINVAFGVQFEFLALLISIGISNAKAATLFIRQIKWLQ